MTSDSLNTERNISEQVPDSQSRTSRYEAGYDGNAESDTELAAGRVDWKNTTNSSNENELSLTAFGMAWPGIVLAFACYQFVSACIVGIYGVFVLGLPPLEIGVLLGLLMISLVIGLIFGIIMSIPAFLLTQLLCWSLNGIVSTRGAIAIFGGMTGFLYSFCWTMFYTNGIPVDLEWQGLVIVFLSLILAIVMGYSGAILAGFLGRYDDFPFFEPIVYLEKQITIRFLFKLTLIVAVLVVLLTAAGWYIGIAWLAYLLVQLFLLVGDHWILGWLGRRSRSKYRRTAN